DRDATNLRDGRSLAARSRTPSLALLNFRRSIANWNIAMDMQASVVAIAGDAEVDHAIATLVLAFGSDPVARWMYDDPHQYLSHIPRLFRALGRSSFDAGAAQRTGDGRGVALWLPPGVYGDDAPLEAVIAGSIVGKKQAEVAAVFEPTEHYRPTEAHWYL